MRRLINYLDALFIGMLLGLIFVSVMHAAPLHRRGKVHANGITIAYESYGRTDREAILLIGGTAMQLIIDDAIAENAARAHDSRAD